MDEEIKNIIQDKIKKIENHRKDIFFQLHPNYPKNKKEKDKQDIIYSLQQLELIYKKILPYIKNIKKIYIKTITEKTKISAAYLLFGKAIQNWETIFLITKDGRNQEVMELTRSLNENLDLINLFLLDNSNSNLNKWFDGEIIENRKARKMIDKFVSQKEFPDYKVSTYIYRILSHYTHNSYATVLDSVDVFNKDFDFNRFASFHYTKRNFHVLKSAMTQTLLSLKMFYLISKDTNNYDKIDQILKEILPEATEEEMKNILQKFKK